MLQILIYIFAIMSASAQVNLPKEKIEAINKPFIGVLEDLKESQKIRVLFTLEKNNWSSIFQIQPSNIEKLAESYPDSLEWKIYFQNNELGSTTSKKIKWKDYSEVGQQEIIIKSNFDLKSISTDDQSRYENWLGVPRYRPLISLSGVRNVKNEQIKTIKLSSTDQNIVFTQFRKRIPRINNCERDKVSSKHDLKKIKNSDIKIIKAFRLENDSLLVGAELDSSLNNCDGPPAEEWSEYWFLISRNKKHFFIGSNIYPVDYITLDNPVRNVWLFIKHGYNEDGYVLYYNEFKSSVMTKWKYH